MKPGPWKKVEELYSAALERDPSERQAFLEEACGDDGALLDEVKSLLTADERAERFIEEPAPEAATRAASLDESRPWLGRRIRGYEVLSLIGVGGMGEVYRAKDTKLDRHVALKVLPKAFDQDPERVGRFQREARLLAALNHPNIAAIYGLEESQGRHVLVLELVEGETLAERIARGPIPTAEALPLFRQLAAGLEAAHERGIIHRDLKPANVTITPQGQVKVLDFGLAKAFRGLEAADSHLDTASPSDEQTGEGRILGTTSYMSPEQARGQVVDKRTDVWAFGCVLYEALTGQRAFRGGTLSDTLAAVLEREVDWDALPRTTPTALRSLLRRCLRKDRDRRLHDIADARIEIEETLAAPAEDESPPASAPTRRGRDWRGAIPWAVSALAIVAAVAMWAPWSGKTPARVVRFEVDVPPEHRLAASWVQLALSPDGRRLAYVAESAGEQRLFLRELDQVEEVALPGTQGAHNPFFSPDGRWVGFVVRNGELKKIALAGGEPVTICHTEAEQNASDVVGSWGPDDTIVYSSRRRLWRVPAGGGTPERIGETGAGDDGELRQDRWPQVLPDGEHVLYSVREPAARYHPAIVSLKTGETRSLDRGQAGARYVSTGHLVYGQSGTLMAAPFDLAELEFTGPPVPIVHGVMTHYNDWAVFAVSPNGTLAYTPGTRSQGHVDWVDPDGHATPLLTEDGQIGFARLSPGGTRVAVARRLDRRDLWIHDLERGDRHRLLVDQGEEAIWTPDSQRITFRDNGLGADRGTSPIFWVRADGVGDVEPVFQDPSITGSPLGWSPDGERLAVRGRGELLVVPRTGEPITFANQVLSVRTARFSPDGRWLAYVAAVSGRRDVYVQPFPGPGERRMISTGGGGWVRWSGDGRELFYAGDDGVLALPFTAAGEPGEPRRLFDRGRFDGRFDVAPDGRFLMTRRPVMPRSFNVVLNWFEELKRLVPEEE